MIRCPDRHENPQTLAHCRVCGLPLIDPLREIGPFIENLRARTILGMPKSMNVLIGTGSVGKKLVLEAAIPGNNGQGEAYSYLIADSTAVSDLATGKTLFNVRIGDAGSHGALFCGSAEHAAEGDLALVPALKGCGLRSNDDRQTVILVTALGGGTGSGTAPVVLRHCHALNPGLNGFVLAISPGEDESVHAHVNALYGLARLLDNGPMSDGVVVVQYDRLKHVHGIGNTGEEIKGEALITSILQLMLSALRSPNSMKFSRLNRAMQTHVLVPCLALGRSLKIFGNLGNVFRSALAYPLAPLIKDNVTISYLLLRIPRRLAQECTDNLVADELSAFNRKYLPGVRAMLFQTTIVEGQSDRIDACLLLGGDSIANAAPAARANYEKFRRQLGDRWPAYGLTEERGRSAEQLIASYDARMEELRESG